MGVSIVMGVPQELDGLFHGKSHLEMDDYWGYPCFGKPAYGKGAVEIADVTCFCCSDDFAELS